MASARRIGAPDAKNRMVLLDAAEQLLIEEGYAAVTSRRVAEKAGLKPQLVHYYFRTMDDLFLEVFRRYADQGMEAHRHALASPQPLWALWRFGINPAASRLTMEMAALANHRKALRAEMSRYAERFREDQRQVFVTVLERKGVLPAEVPPVVWSILLTGVSTVVMLGEALGVTVGARRNPGTRREFPDRDGGSAAIDGRLSSPVAQRAECALGAGVLRDHNPVDGKHAVKIRRGRRQSAGSRHHRPFVRVG